MDAQRQQEHLEAEERNTQLTNMVDAQRRALDASEASKSAADAIRRKHAIALARIADVIFEVHVQEWSEAAVRACRLQNATASFEALFGRPCNRRGARNLPFAFAPP